MAFWTRTRRYMALVWGSAIVLEAVAFELFRRTFDSWVLLWSALLLAVPFAGWEMTSRWRGRPRRRRWKVHDLEDAVRAGRDEAEVREELVARAPSV